ncbi:MAG: Flp pilus assembly protein CpaB [Gammaproteobacteria bacterium]
MSSRFLIAIAVFLLIGAGLSAYWGIQQTSPNVEQSISLADSTENEIAPQKSSDSSMQSADKEAVTVVMLARDVSADTPLTRDDILIQSMQIAPPYSFRNEEQVIGKALWRDYLAGAVLNENAFGHGGPLPRMIRADERALAISVDEILSSGGHLQPGDYVDVLLYLKQDMNNADHSMQVVMPALRVLGVGEELGNYWDGSSMVANTSAVSNTVPRRAIPRSIVLAVPESLVTRFSLAAHVGALSLAVRSAEDLQAANYYQSNLGHLQSIRHQLVQFEEFALKGELSVKAEASGVTPEKGVDVFRGSVLSRDVP